MSLTVQRAWLQTPLWHKPISARKQIQRTSTTSTLPTLLPPLQLPCPQRPSPSLPNSSCLLCLSQIPSPRLPHSCMLHAPPQPHVPCVSHLPHLPFLLHLPCPIMWVHMSRLDHGMPPPFPLPSIPPRHLNLNLSRSYWEKTVD